MANQGQQNLGETSWMAGGHTIYDKNDRSEVDVPREEINEYGYTDQSNRRTSAEDSAFG